MPARRLDGREGRLDHENGEGGREVPPAHIEPDVPARVAGAHGEHQSVPHGGRDARTVHAERGDEQRGEDHAGDGADHRRPHDVRGVHGGGVDRAVERVEDVHEVCDEQDGDHGPCAVELALQEHHGEPGRQERDERAEDGHRGLQGAEHRGEEALQPLPLRLLEGGELPRLLEHGVGGVEEVGELAGRREHAGRGDAEHAGDEEAVDAGADPPEERVGDERQRVAQHRRAEPLEALHARAASEDRARAVEHEAAHPAGGEVDRHGDEGARRHRDEVARDRHAEPADEGDGGGARDEGRDAGADWDQPDLPRAAGDLAEQLQERARGVGEHEPPLVGAEPAERAEVERGREQRDDQDGRQRHREADERVLRAAIPIPDDETNGRVRDGQCGERGNERDNHEGHVGDTVLPRTHEGRVERDEEEGN